LYFNDFIYKITIGKISFLFSVADKRFVYKELN